MTLIYVLPSGDNLKKTLQGAMDIYAVSGMQPVAISDGVDSYKFNTKDASLVVSGVETSEQYAEKNHI